MTRKEVLEGERFVQWIKSQFLLAEPDACDVAQQARLITLLKKGVTSEGEGSAYLREVASRLVMNLKSKHQRHAAKAQEVPLETADFCEREVVYSNPFEAIETHLLLDQLKESQIISCDDWELIELHYLQGYTYKEIAEQKNMKLKKIAARIERSIQKLQEWAKEF